MNLIDPSTIPPHDILTGGFPCQPFSVAGYREGFKDERSNVFWKIMEIVDYHSPKCILLENVKNLLTHDDGKTFKTITENLEKRGYSIKYKVLNTAVITGIPQHRERIYIVCFKPFSEKSKQEWLKFNLDFKTLPKKSVSEMLINTKVEDKYYYTEKSSTWNLVSKHVIKKNIIYQYRCVYERK